VLLRRRRSTLQSAVKSDRYRRTFPIMDTFVTIEIPGTEASDESVEPAFEWFNEIESRCSRFDPQSELIQLSHRIGETVPVSAILFEAVRFALAVAENTGGAFDPTVGHAMESLGFNREYQTGATIQSNIHPEGSVSFRDVVVDEEHRSVT